MVHWQNTEAYQFIRSQGSETYVADQNRIANPNGVHNVAGLAISQGVASIFSWGINQIGAHQESGGLTNLFSASGTTNYINKFKRANKKYENALADYKNESLTQEQRNKAKERASKYLALMGNYSEKSKTLANAYTTAKGKMPK